MNVHRTRPNTLPWPPIVYGTGLLAAIVLAWQVPLSIDVAAVPVMRAAGAVLVLGGLALDLWAARTLHEARTTIMPHRASSHLVTGGPYRFSRNPIYVGNTLVLIGIGLAVADAWFLIAALAAALVTQQVAIRREEQHLLSLFGVRFEEYCRRTRRWL